MFCRVVLRVENAVFEEYLEGSLLVRVVVLFGVFCSGTGLRDRGSRVGGIRPNKYEVKINLRPMRNKLSRISLHIVWPVGKELSKRGK